MHLTTLTLQGRRVPRNAHALHRAIAATCGGGRILWAHPQHARIVIRSAEPPDWGAFPGATGAAAAPGVTTPTQGDTVSWALIANPSKAIPTPIGADGTRPRGRRVALPEDEVSDWARRKLADALDVTSLNADRLAPARGHKPDGTRITLARYALAGTATVADPEALAELQTRGVGAGKAFGCGLLIVRER